MHSKRALRVFSAHLKQMSRDFTQATPGSLGEAAIPKVEGMMDAWVTEVFKSPPARRQISVPRISRPDQVLVKIKASSINPIDPQMTNGYGNELLSNWAQLENNSWNPLAFYTSQKSDRLPLITGRDFSGEIVQVGSNVRDYLPGDEIIGVVPAHWQGSHAEYCLASLNGIARKPISVGHVEACAYAYTACTAWSALVKIARINKNNAHNTRVLIHGGSGGVGSTAIQLLKAWGVPKIIATCSEKNAQSIQKLGVKAVDYNSPSAKDEIIAEGPYEVILDCVDSELSRWSDEIMGIWRNCVHVSVVSPLLGDMDRYGVAMGVASTAAKLFCRSCKSTLYGRWQSYAFFMPSAECLEELSLLIDQKKINPLVANVYGFSHLPEAYSKVGQSNGAGKVVIDHTKK